MVGALVNELLRCSRLVEISLVTACKLVEPVSVVVPPGAQFRGRGQIGATLIELSIVLLDPSRYPLAGPALRSSRIFTARKVVMPSTVSRRDQAFFLDLKKRGARMTTSRMMATQFAIFA